MVGYIYAPASSDVNDFSVAALFSLDITPKSWQESFQANILSLIALIDVSTPHLMKNFATASIVVISSLAGFEAIYHAVAGPYTTIKRAQATLAKDYAASLVPLACVSTRLYLARSRPQGGHCQMGRASQADLRWRDGKNLSTLRPF
jgi:hypothetical protein